MTAILPDNGASCADAAPPATIDVAALSVGKPDGVYYAGRRLTPWMLFEERVALSRLEPRWARDTPQKQAEYRARFARRTGESVVVRWEIADGRPSAPTTLVHKHEEYDDSHSPRRQVDHAYIWGRSADGRQHIDVVDLGHRMLADALVSIGKGMESTNPYIDHLMAGWLDDPGNEWVIPLSAVVQVIRVVNLRKAHVDFVRAERAARDAGVDVDAVLKTAGKG